MPLRYVILHHTGIDEPHFDLMFERASGSTLATWRSPCWPLATPQPVRRISDHRREYLDYEGKIAGNRGQVHRVEANDYQLLADNEHLFAAGLSSLTQTLIFRRDPDHPDQWIASWTSAHPSPDSSIDPGLI